MAVQRRAGRTQLRTLPHLSLIHISTALNEITLVLFTTLAPSGAVAYVIMGMAALRAQGDERKRLSGALLIPFLVTLVGLVASATHLGNPDNALYVFSRVGASPLSNEVCAAVLFLGISGLHWLYQMCIRDRVHGMYRMLVQAAEGTGELPRVSFLGIDSPADALGAERGR